MTEDRHPHALATIALAEPAAIADGDPPTHDFIRPVFLAVGDRRQRLLRRSGYLTALAAVSYLGVVVFSVVALPTVHSTRSPSSAVPATVGTATRNATTVAAPSTTAAPRGPVGGAVDRDDAPVLGRARAASSPRIRASADRPGSTRTAVSTTPRRDQDHTTVSRSAATSATPPTPSVTASSSRSATPQPRTSR